jgi:selenide,water dikinase
MAINLAAYPDGLGMDILSEILRGGAEKVREAGAVIAGGHTVTDKEPKYGLAVTGEVHPQRIVRKSGAKPGDALILTKPLGAGVITTALKRGAATEDHIADAVRGMSHLNRRASEIALTYPVHAMTDITGYGLLGHAHEMAHLSQVDFVLNFDSFLFYAGTREYAEQEIFAGGMYRNQEYYSPRCSFSAARSEIDQYLLYDPQTSGGLLIAVSDHQADGLLRMLLEDGERACLVGEVVSGTGNLRIE